MATTGTRASAGVAAKRLATHTQRSPRRGALVRPRPGVVSAIGVIFSRRARAARTSETHSLPRCATATSRCGACKAVQDGSTVSAFADRDLSMEGYMVRLWREWAVAVAVVLFVGPAAGGTFGPPAAVNSDAATDTQEDGAVQIATDGAGHWVAVWIADKAAGPSLSERDVFVARSSDNGATWTDIAPLNTNAPRDFGSDTDPSIPTHRAGNWGGVWTSSDPPRGTAHKCRDIVAARSTDNGATWSAPAPVNIDAATDKNRIDERPWIATDGHGQWIAVWQSFDILPSTDMDIMFARSTDAGATWSAPAFLNNDF